MKPTTHRYQTMIYNVTEQNRAICPFMKFSLSNFNFVIFVTFRICALVFIVLQAYN